MNHYFHHKPNRVTCHHCGTDAGDRQYCALTEVVTCEHCLLDSRKREAGLRPDPYELFVEALAGALDLREHETGLHSKRVACHTVVLARHFYDSPDMLREVYWGSLLHDIGKIGVPDAILLKRGGLSAEEWEVMRLHPEAGYHLVKPMPYLSVAAEIIRCHEERFDGSGYPRGLRGEDIPLPARLFAVIDTLDAMTFDRPYRKALPFDDARAEILRMSGSQFDPKAVDSFLKSEAALREMVALEFLQVA